MQIGYITPLEWWAPLWVALCVTAVYAAAIGTATLPIQPINILAYFIVLDNIIMLHVAAAFERGRHARAVAAAAVATVVVSPINSWGVRGSPAPVSFSEESHFIQPTMIMTTSTSRLLFAVSFLFSLGSYLTLVWLCDGYALHPALSIVSSLLMAIMAATMAMVHTYIFGRCVACYGEFGKFKDAKHDVISAVEKLKEAIEGIAALSKELSPILVPKAVLYVATCSLAVYALITDRNFLASRIAVLLLCLITLAVLFVVCITNDEGTVGSKRLQVASVYQVQGC